MKARPARRQRLPLWLPLLGAAAFALTLAALHLRRPVEAAGPAVAEPLRADSRATTGQRNGPAATPAAASGSAPELPVLLSEAEARPLIEQAMGTDQRQRALAIEALGRAPRAIALPALERIVKNAEDDVDRHIAVGALHELAMQQGDAGGSIRDLLRELVFDGNDEAVSENAAAALDSLELPRPAAPGLVRTSR